MQKTGLKRTALLLSWLLALAGLLITLYSSEILKLPVCHLCWYQRICLYPLMVVLGIAVFRDDLTIPIYAIPLALIGAVFALYQYLEQMIPGFSPINVCGAGPSCSDIHFHLFGFITYPFLSLVNFLVLTALLFITKPR